MKRTSTPLSRLRKSRTISQVELASLLGISQQHLSLIEKGLMIPRFDLQAHIAAILGASQADLFPIRDPGAPQ